MPRHAGISTLERVLLIGSLLLVATTVAAQPSAPTSGPVRGAATPLRYPVAESLEAHASRLAARSGGWLEAARLQRRAALQRSDDTSAISAWARASWLYAAAGKLGIARQMMVKCAEHAAAGGDVERAVIAYLDAALIAADDERTDLVPVLLRRMRRIAQSPLLPLERREQLIARAVAEPRLARYASPVTTADSTTDPR